MRPPPAAIRRGVIDPLWIPIAAALAVLFLLAGIAGTLAVPLSHRRRPLRLGVFGAIYLAVDVWLLIRCTLLWLRHPLPSRRDQAGWSRSHQELLRRALARLVSAARPLLGFRAEVQEPPEHDQGTGRPLLMLARHGGPGDSFALVELLLTRYQRRPTIVLKESLRWDPGLDLVLGRLPSCFIRRGAGSQATERIADLAASMSADDAILLFPEGGNWTPRRHYRAISRLRRAGRRQDAADAADNPHLLPPRPAGLLACLAARPDLDVAIVAHTGLEDLINPGLIWRALPVSARPMVIRWWHEPASVLPDTDEDKREWLRLQWAVVDSWIDSRKAARVPAGLLDNAADAALPLSSTGGAAEHGS
jgi:1-acyl-sn-glycerol-3-phosphate acyltransferase